MNKLTNNYFKLCLVNNFKIKNIRGLLLIVVFIITCSAAKPAFSSSFSYSSIAKHFTVSKHHLSAGTDTIVYSGPPVICSDGSVVLSAGNVSSNTSFRWYKNGGSTPIATTATYTATTPGTYSLTTISNGTTVNYSPLVITQDSTPVAQFTYTTTSDCPSSAVNFINQSTGNDLSYAWNFGDPNSVKYSRTSNLANPSHTFIGTTGNGTQTFTVTLVVTTKGGCTSTATKTITLSQSPDTKLGGIEPTAFNGRDYFASCTNAPTIFTFTNLSTTDNSSYNIYWGDGSGNTTLNSFTSISHTYKVGSFTLFYTVYGKNGCSLTKKYYIFVGKSPVASLSNSPVFTCTNSPIVIQTQSLNSNSAGTIYTVNFSDGVSNNYTTTPDTIMHTFLSNSVNKTSTRQSVKFNNSYSATLIASNPCGSDTAIIAPIYVSDVPKAIFNINLNTICAGDSIICTNANSQSAYIDSSGNAHSQKIIWTVTPNSGYVVNSSALGQNNGTNIPSLWSDGSQKFNIKFTNAGYYTLKLITGNNVCGTDSLIRSVCVNPSPVALFSLSDTSDCTPFLVTATNESNKPLCGANSYKWIVSYVNNDCGLYSGNYSYQSGDSTAVNPAFNFTDPGIYTISLVNTYNASQCSSAVFSKQVIVREKPVVAISSPNEGITNQKLQVGGSLKNCNSLINPTFLWLFPGAEPSSSIAFKPDSVVYNQPGNYIISFSVTDECGTTTVNKNIKIADNISLANAFIPNCFTPNGDGINDTWNISGIEAEHLLFLQVFNRYGELVSQIRGNPITWDGKYKGEKLPAGVYFYVLSIYNDNLHTEKRSGSVTIIY